MLNILTIDIEDYFQVHAFSNVIKYEDWDKFECRIERNTDHILEILNEVKTEHSELSTQNSNLLLNASRHKPYGSVKVTFFVLGWIAERYPELIQRIQKEGHEIACHGYAHKLIYNQSKEEFRKDVKKAKSTLEDIIGDEVIGYRAPSYSIIDKSKWAFEVLLEEGFKYDSSIFPIRHDYYGIPNAPRFPFIIHLNKIQNVEFSVLNYELKTFQNSKFITQNSKFIIEFPISTVRILGQNFPISGGGYFRLFPYPLIRKGLKSINQKQNKPFIFYVHPWEFDVDQPRIKDASNLSKFRHYVNLDKTKDRFKKLLKDFKFSSIKQILELNNLLAE
jgi:polysaccharide deacetylase family protein (PEP-CTERM system associated)